jgi:hypothetical protein
MFTAALLVTAALGQITNLETSGTVTGISDPSGWCTDGPFVQVGDPLSVSFTDHESVHEGLATLEIGPYVGVLSATYFNGELTMSSHPGPVFWPHPAIPLSFFRANGQAEILFAWDGGYTDPPLGEYIDCTVTATISPLSPRVIGDANTDGLFDSSDLVDVFIAGEYEDTTRFNSTWQTGDWDANRDFNSGDLVIAFQAGTYEQPAAAMPVPEPSGWVLAFVCVAFIRLPNPFHPSA